MSQALETPASPKGFFNRLISPWQDANKKLEDDAKQKLHLTMYYSRLAAIRSRFHLWAVQYIYDEREPVTLRMRALILLVQSSVPFLDTKNDDDMRMAILTWNKYVGEWMTMVNHLEHRRLQWLRQRGGITILPTGSLERTLKTIADRRMIPLGVTLADASFGKESVIPQFVLSMQEAPQMFGFGGGAQSMVPTSGFPQTANSARPSGAPVGQTYDTSKS